MAYRLRFGSYDLPATMRPVGSDGSIDLGEQERPRADGSVTQIGRRKSRVLQVRGSITAATADLLQAAYDALKVGVMTSATSALWFGRDDRYINAQLESWTDDTDDGMTWGVVVNIALGFRCADPFFYATSPTSPTLSTSGGTITVPNTTSAVPAWSVTVSGTATGVITLTNSTTGETATITGALVNGDVIAIDRGAYTVTRNGVAEFGLLAGRIPGLQAGANVIAASATGVTISALACTYTARYQ